MLLYLAFCEGIIAHGRSIFFINREILKIGLINREILKIGLMRRIVGSFIEIRIELIGKSFTYLR